MKLYAVKGGDYFLKLEGDKGFDFVNLEKASVFPGIEKARESIKGFSERVSPEIKLKIIEMDISMKEVE